MVQETSAIAHKKEVATGRKGFVKEKILQVLISAYPLALSDEDIMEQTGCDKRNVISSSRNALYIDGQVVEIGKKTSPTSTHKVITWAYNPNPLLAPVRRVSYKDTVDKVRALQQQYAGQMFIPANELAIILANC